LSAVRVGRLAPLKRSATVSGIIRDTYLLDIALDALNERLDSLIRLVTLGEAAHVDHVYS
jgi:hypothetical protein